MSQVSLSQAQVVMVYISVAYRNVQNVGIHFKEIVTVIAIIFIYSGRLTAHTLLKIIS